MWLAFLSPKSCSPLSDMDAKRNKRLRDVIIRYLLYCDSSALVTKIPRSHGDNKLWRVFR